MNTSASTWGLPPPERQPVSYRVEIEADDWKIGQLLSFCESFGGVVTELEKGELGEPRTYQGVYGPKTAPATRRASWVVIWPAQNNGHSEGFVGFVVELGGTIEEAK